MATHFGERAEGAREIWQAAGKLQPESRVAGKTEINKVLKKYKKIAFMLLNRSVEISTFLAVPTREPGRDARPAK